MLLAETQDKQNMSSLLPLPNLTMKSPLIYRTKSNIQSSYSIKEKYEQDYLELRDILKKNNVSIGDYLVNAYQELDKGSPNFQRIKTIRYSR